MSMSPEVTSGLLTLVGVIVGATLTWGQSWYRQRQDQNAHLMALSVEIDSCKTLAKFYSDKKDVVAQYRLPTAAFENSYPSILRAGVLKEEHLHALQDFFIAVQGLNRGLDHTLDFATTAELRAAPQLMNVQGESNQQYAKLVIERHPRAHRVFEDLL